MVGCALIRLYIAGCVNILTSKRFITPTSTAMANNSCLIEVEKWEGEAK